MAEPVGSDGVLIGIRGNITKNTPLAFSALSTEDQADIIVLAHTDFSWGDNSSRPLLTQEEFDRIKKVFEEQMFYAARELAFKKYNKKDEFIPLPIPEAFSLLDSTLSTDVVVGEQKSEVTFSAKANYLLYLYRVGLLRKTLLETAQAHLLEGTESLIEISAEAPPEIIATLAKTDLPFTIRATAQIPVKVLYDFSSITGQRTLQNILSDLLHADVDRVEKTLLNHPYIKSVRIRLTPFWSHKLPNSLEKIFIKVQNEN